MENDYTGAVFEDGILVEYRGGRISRKDTPIDMPKQLTRLGRLTLEEINEAFTPLKGPKPLSEFKKD